MSIIEIRPAERAGARLVIGFASVSGGGKTRTAIEFAYGLAGYQAGKVGLLDTENRRGRLYSDCLKESTRPTNDKFLHADLYAPFSPSRYAEAIQEFQNAGVEVLVIDSGTHEYEGIGGVEEIAHAGNSKMPNWNKAKAEHKRFMNVLLTCDMHIIVCVRAREKSRPVKDDNGKTVWEHLGLIPIQEKNFMFEMTASLMLHNQGTFQEPLKVPQSLMPYLGRGEGYITAADGYAVRQWVDGGMPVDPKVEKYRNALLSRTEKGVADIRECWDKTPAPIRVELGEGFYQQIVASAQAFEDQKKPSYGDDGEGVPAILSNAMAAEETPPPAKAVEQTPPAPAEEQKPQEPAPAPVVQEQKAPAPTPAPAAQQKPVTPAPKPAPVAAATKPAPAASTKPPAAAATRQPSKASEALF